MALACRIIKLNPEYDNLVKDMFKKKKDFIYEKINRDDKHISLKFYVDNVEENNSGKYIVSYIDLFRMLWTKDSGNEPAKYTKKVEMQLYVKKGLDNYLAIFSPNSLVIPTVKAMTYYLFKEETKEWILPIFFDLEKQEKDVRRKFGDFRRVYVKEMDDELIKSAIMGGITVQRSPDYARFMRDYGGKLSAVAVLFDGMWIMITDKGTFFSPNKEAEDSKILLIHNLMKELLEIDVVKNISEG